MIHKESMRTAELWCWHELKRCAIEEEIRIQQVSDDLNVKYACVAHIYSKVLGRYPIDDDRYTWINNLNNEYLEEKKKNGITLVEFCYKKKVGTSIMSAFQGNANYLARIEKIKESPPFTINSYKECIDKMKTYLPENKIKEKPREKKSDKLNFISVAAAPIKVEAKNSSDNEIKLFDKYGICISISKQTDNEKILKIIQLIKDL